MELIPQNQLPESREIDIHFTFTNKEEFPAKLKVYKTTNLGGLLFLLRLQYPQFMAVKWENTFFKDAEGNAILLNDNIFDKVIFIFILLFFYFFIFSLIYFFYFNLFLFFIFSLIYFLNLFFFF